ncbi:hypothetical protein [Mesorhizobium sp.]|uniref:hypothetical protein n=1 Tax=Mesorhizobium sp. TaxID=1871066 RepID=UPI000FE9D742|nr:hypothetical protein [Mesorhizobium sp.]RWO53205.1 MAG: hypothetical protein EOS13_10620 [Mesorhizobium sp.]TIN25217.1 MAG: hypothetical protein E5Y19_18875 [Mesorhizobium sp.]TIN42270.1 MAG: hypothetical protein E5Y13_00135 [Mesorhizobium sp.]TJU81710.1 MAG: hypothetical protein E5Y15_19290 [Mesorhizobium sp.]TJU84956.1 MAG: hypothetical protein E5Y10_27370 [Mesorhizobium sp.]
MAATVKFGTTGTDKWLKVTDNISRSVVDEWFQKTTDNPQTITVSTFDETNGEVKIEVRRTAKDSYSDHDKQLPVEDGQAYSIDDSGLPPIKEEKPTDTE